MRAGRTALVWVLVGMLLAGCTPGEPETAPATQVPAAPSPSPSPEESPSPSPSPSEVLEARYHQDSDGNVIPDFVEVELGLDPAVDDCLAGPCPQADAALLTPDQDALQRNVLLVLDASGSMAGQDGAGNVKLDAATAALERFVVGTPDTTDLGLMVYGHRGTNEQSGKAESCAGIEVFAPLGQLDPATAPAALDQFAPTGWTPIAASLQRATSEFTGREGQDNHIVLVTDGIETCGGDPVVAAAALKQAGIAVTVDVVGFDVADPAEQQALRRIAEVTGGTYTDARDAAQLNSYIDTLLQQQSELLAAFRCLEDAWLNSGVCRVQSSEAASPVLAALRDQFPVQSPRYEAIDNLRIEIFTYSIETNEAANDVYIPRIRQLLDAYAAARDRYQQQYGQTLAFDDDIPPCPLLAA